MTVTVFWWPVAAVTSKATKIQTMHQCNVSNDSFKWPGVHAFRNVACAWHRGENGWQLDQ